MADSRKFWDEVEAAFDSGEAVILTHPACDRDGSALVGPVQVVRFNVGEVRGDERAVYATFRSEDGRVWEAEGIQQRARILPSPLTRECQGCHHATLSAESGGTSANA